MIKVRVVASGEASNTDLVRLRALLDDAFDHEFSDEDWDHALGGWHAIVTVDRLPVSHCRRGIARHRGGSDGRGPRT